MTTGKAFACLHVCRSLTSWRVFVPVILYRRGSPSQQRTYWHALSPGLRSWYAKTYPKMSSMIESVLTLQQLQLMLNTSLHV